MVAECVSAWIPGVCVTPPGPGTQAPGAGLLGFGAPEDSMLILAQDLVALTAGGERLDGASALQGCFGDTLPPVAGIPIGMYRPEGAYSTSFTVQTISSGLEFTSLRVRKVVDTPRTM